MSNITEKKISELVCWYEYNKKGITDVKKKNEFLEKAIVSVLLVMIEIAEDLKVVEGRGRMTNSSNIILPANSLLKKNERKHQVQVK